MVAAVFVLAWLGLGLFYGANPVLYDADAYYHLAIARLYGEQGPFVEELPQLRFSAFRDGFGDKEALFHGLLVPFVGDADASAERAMAGGGWALAFFNALLVAILAAFGHRALGRWGLLLPAGLILGSLELTWRLVRLRPEQLSLALLLLALAAAGQRRDRLVGVLAFVYTLSYTAFQAFLGLFGLIFLWSGWVRRDWRWRLPVFTAAGVVFGLVVHPQFPHQLEIWVQQNVTYFGAMKVVEVGSELRPNSTETVLFANLAWFLALGALLLASRRHQRAVSDETIRLADGFAIATAAFGGLYLLMSRFSTYFFVFAALWLLFELQRRRREVGGWVALPGRGRLPLALALALIAVIALPGAARELHRFQGRTATGPDQARLQDRDALSRLLPPAARVLAPHPQTGLYMLWAPTARFINALDPVPIYQHDPAIYRVYRDIFAGSEPDVPLMTATALDSDFLVYSVIEEDRRELNRRIAADPRLEPLHRHFTGIYRLVKNRNRSFVRDWQVRLRDGSTTPYPLATATRAAAFEGFVDAARVGAADACLRFERTLQVDDATVSEYELAPYGPAALWLDGSKIVETHGSLRAVLGEGLRVRLEPAPGPHLLTIETCPAAGRNGFYLRQLSRQPTDGERR